jgi:hypothetical protein
MENERLQQCLAGLKAQLDSQITASGQTLPSANPMYATSLPRSEFYVLVRPWSRLLYFLSGSQYINSLDDALNSAAATYDNAMLGGNYNEDQEDDARKKKVS